MKLEGIGWTLAWLLFGTLTEEWFILHASYFGSSSFAEFMGVLAWILASALVLGFSQLFFWRGFDAAYINSVDYACLIAGVASVLTVIGTLNEFHVRNYDELTAESRKAVNVLKTHVDNYRHDICGHSTTSVMERNEALCRFMDDAYQFSVSYDEDVRLSKLNAFKARPDGFCCKDLSGA